MSEEIEEYIENIMTTFPDMNQSHRRMMQKVGYRQQKEIDSLKAQLAEAVDIINETVNGKQDTDYLADRFRSFLKSLEEKEGEEIEQLRKYLMKA